MTTPEAAPDVSVPAPPTSRPRLVAAAFLLIATAAFVGGSLVERGRHHEPAAPREAFRSGETTATPGEGVAMHEESGEHAESNAVGTTTTEESPTAQGAEGVERKREGTEGKVFGVNVESPSLIVTGALVSLLLAAAVVVVPGPIALRGATVLALAFAVLEIGEVAHQRSTGDALLVALAAIALAGHLAAGTTAALVKT